MPGLRWILLITAAVVVVADADAEVLVD